MQQCEGITDVGAIADADSTADADCIGDAEGTAGEEVKDYAASAGGRLYIFS